MTDTKQDELTRIKTCIEKMNKFHQVGVLKLLSSREDLTINENNNGVFINLSDLDEEIIKQLSNYIHYVNEQESDLNQHEQEKEKYKNVFFDNDSSCGNPAKKIKTIEKENKDMLVSSVSDNQCRSSSDQ